MRNLLVVLCVLMVLLSCGSKKKIVTKKRNAKKVERVVVVNDDTPAEATPLEDKPSESVENRDVKVYANATEKYIATYSDIAMIEMKAYKIPASITLAQGLLESGAGQGRLSVQANNHFGIKCHGWTGDKIYHDDDSSQECFRKYTHAQLSFEDHSIFLTSRGRYSKLFELDEDDYKGWAKGLRAAGYATDRRYPDKLIDLIERYKLYEYDEMVLKQQGSRRTKKVVPTPMVETSQPMTHKVAQGETLYSLSKKYNTSVDELKRLNRLGSNTIDIGQVLIIKSK